MRKKKEKRKNAAVTAEMLNRKAVKQIIFVITAAVLLLTADMLMTSAQTLKIIKSYGQLYLIRPETGEENGYLTLKANIVGENEMYEKKVNVMLKPYESKQEPEGADNHKTDDIVMTEQEKIDYELRALTEQLNSDSSVKKVKLPDSLDSGEKISWQIEESSQSNSFAIIIITFFISIVLYKNRLLPLEKEKRANRESVVRQLPEFVNRLVLLLNAGLVINSAFEKAVSESFSFTDEEDYFNRRMKEIYVSVKTANASMHKELKRFSREVGIKEFMRVSNIISDNVNKGVELADKLQIESEILWLNRKKNCEEQSKMAETKLTLPLVIFLMVLIVITVAPALLEL